MFEIKITERKPDLQGFTMLVLYRGKEKYKQKRVLFPTEGEFKKYVKWLRGRGYKIIVP